MSKRDWSIIRHNKNLWEVPIDKSFSSSRKGFFNRKKSARTYLSRDWTDEEFKANFIRRPTFLKVDHFHWLPVYKLINRSNLNDE